MGGKESCKIVKARGVKLGGVEQRWELEVGSLIERWVVQNSSAVQVTLSNCSRNSHLTGPRTTNWLQICQDTSYTSMRLVTEETGHLAFYTQSSHVGDDEKPHYNG